ncbi:LysR family transcriptional regulator [Photobacterium sp. 1_MG-2023]|uniref:LysR family transcriptional regulator n=1 Tax=Photobacterium sp. 1_MG-2023 TaxID=3062646 RepID=UPI0026E3AB3E|nr:LysR family transcriptional regulator [Photobacterium sp. 1_MG-2023]MDO6705080.1 LysR family transcriptional regulator [Photobacterium sp. 1_MG-2023]
MKLKQLKNFLVVSKTLSFSAAAEATFLSIPAISTQIKALEEHFGFKLFDRNRRGLSLTPKGEQIIPLINEFIEATERLEKEIYKIHNEGAASITLALNSSLPNAISENIFNAVHSYDKISDIELSYSETSDNLKKLEEGTVDAAVIIGEPKPLRLDCHPIHLGEVSAVLACSHESKITDIDSIRDKIIKPSADCPFYRLYRSIDSKETDGTLFVRNNVLSGSEHFTIQLIETTNAIGIVSKSNAIKHRLFILDEFEERLPSYLLINKNKVSQSIIEQLNTSLNQEMFDKHVTHYARHY